MALLAAYMVALQTLLLPLTVAASAGYDESLCVKASADPRGAPVGHDAGCACAAGCGMACCAPALAAPPAAYLPYAAAVIDVVKPPTAAVSGVSPQGKSPHNPRAPPVA